MLAALGVVEVEVHAAPQVTILATGDELIAPGPARWLPDRCATP